MWRQYDKEEDMGAQGMCGRSPGTIGVRRAAGYRVDRRAAAAEVQPTSQVGEARYCRSKTLLDYAAMRRTGPVQSGERKRQYSVRRQLRS